MSMGGDGGGGPTISSMQAPGPVPNDPGIAPYGGGQQPNAPIYSGPSAEGMGQLPPGDQSRFWPTQYGAIPNPASVPGGGGQPGGQAGGGPTLAQLGQALHMMLQQQPGQQSMAAPQAVQQINPQAGPSQFGVGSAQQQQQNLSPLQQAQQAAAAQNAAVYGTSDPQKLGMLASAGFPQFNDPRLIQDRLAQMAMNGDEAARQQLLHMTQPGGGGWSGGAGGGDTGREGEGGAGGGGEHASGGGAGQDASGQW